MEAQVSKMLWFEKTEDKFQNNSPSYTVLYLMLTILTEEIPHYKLLVEYWLK
jgi:hypothetical protein